MSNGWQVVKETIVLAGFPTLASGWNSNSPLVRRVENL